MAKVFKDGTVLTFDDTTQSIRVLPKASILIVDDRIAAISKDETPNFPQDAEIINVHGKIISPGFVNTHIHTWQTVYRTIGPNVFLSQYFGCIPIKSPHAPFLTTSDQKALRENNHFISITPEFRFGHGQTTGHQIIDQASLGLDTNWTFSGDMLSQTRLWLQYTRLTNSHRTLETGKLSNTNPFPVEEVFLMATR